MMVNATRRAVTCELIRHHEIDPEKVRALVDHLVAGGTVPPVVLAVYGRKALALDGNHRVLALRQLEREVDAWVISGRAFDRLCTLHRDAENHVLCGGVMAMQVAGSERTTGSSAGPAGG
ncbi:hypothetical protein [Ottowia sp.]|uniref:hypothetical protein n=1 Tax=Ottowia sp. TaxID=1898956 RepID=UPI0025DDC63F|nr:hypothetical protein [Ottowia sp.]MBK6616392.1 hypothetical protein [Ottowia sp.]